MGRNKIEASAQVFFLNFHVALHYFKQERASSLGIMIYKCGVLK